MIDLDSLIANEINQEQPSELEDDFLESVTPHLGLALGTRTSYRLIGNKDKLPT